MKTHADPIRPPTLSRRSLLPALALGAIGAPGVLSWRRALAAGAPIEAEPIAPGLTVFRGAGGHVLVHETDASLLLVDGGSPDTSAALLTAIAEHHDGKPVAMLVNTHWHLDQTGSNDSLGAGGTTIIAHENTRRWMTTRIEQGFGGPVYMPRREVALPTRTLRVSDTVRHGDTALTLGHTPRAHTDGDLHAVFHDANVIAAGGVAYARRYPVLDTATNGWIGEMLDATRTLLAASDDSTIIVPAEGPLVSRADLLAQETLLDTVLTRFQDYSRQGMGADDMLAAGIAAEFEDEFGDPTGFIHTAWDGLWDHMRGLRAF